MWGRRRHTATIATAFVSVAMLAVIATPAIVAADPTATVIEVTTFADTVDPSDGLVSFREAVDQANASAVPATIKLTNGNYALDRCSDAPDAVYDCEDLNASTDLDITAPASVTIEGNGATLTQACQNQRLLHARAAGGDLTVRRLRFEGGQSDIGAAHLTIGPAPTALTDTSNLNIRAAETRANAVLSPTSTDSFWYIRNNTGATHALIDTTGILA